MSQQPFGDIPFFREMQRLLEASSGPVNYEIARQVANAVATQGLSDTDPPPEVVRAYTEAVASAEPIVAGFTRLSMDEPARVEVIGRGRWIAATLDSWRWVLDRMAERFVGEISRMSEGEEAQAMNAALGQVAPLLVGVQTGTLIGHLATEALVRHDLPIPRDDDGRPFLVWGNAQAVADEYGFERDSFLRWLALRDISRHIVVSAVPWAARYLRGALTDVVDALEIDAGGIEQRLMELQTKGMEGLSETFGADGALPIAETPRHRMALDRLRAFVALLEGYAEHACDEIAPSFIGDTARIDEGMTRRKASPSEGAELLSSVLGVSLDRALENSGVTFCAAVTKLRGVGALNQVWEAPDNLPTLEEIRDPFAWMERILPEGGSP